MTEDITATAHKFMREAVEERGGLCACGAHGNDPCWRAATELRWLTDREPTICGEHARLFDLEERVEQSLEDLDSMHGWIAQLGAQFQRGADRSRLDDRLRATFEEMLAEHLGLVLQMRGAELIAAQGEGDEPLEPEEAERIARGLMLSDALWSAGSIVEDNAPGIYGGFHKWFILAAIQEARGKE